MQKGDFGLDDLDEQKMISLLTDVIEKINKENQELSIQQAHIQVTSKSVYCFGNIVQMQNKCKCFNTEML